MNSWVRRSVLLVAVVFAVLLLAGPASAQWIAGSAITVDNIDDGTLTVDITGSIFYTTGVGFSTAFVGVTSGFGTIAPAVDFGDGSSIPPYWPGGSGIPFDQISTPTSAPGPVRAYRMAFSHAYGAEGTYDITINSHFTGGISPAIVFTGTTTTAPTPSYATFGGIQTFVQNVASVTVGAAPADIPTSSDLGLLALALVLGLTGMFVLRR